MTLASLHEVLQLAMGWEDSHLHVFEVGRKKFTGNANALDIDVHESSEVLLGSIAPRVGSKLDYVYDFGDLWEHRIVVEAIAARENGEGSVRCVAGKRACPPEDCGGPRGYEDLLRALRNPRRKDHQEMREWVGQQFDPEAFDCNAINAALERAARRSAQSSRRP